VTTPAPGVSRARDDFFDWTKATQDLLASGEKIDAAIQIDDDAKAHLLRAASFKFQRRQAKGARAVTGFVTSMAPDQKISARPLIARQRPLG